jgi:hypothetical protein
MAVQENGPKPLLGAHHKWVVWWDSKTGWKSRNDGERTMSLIDGAQAHLFAAVHR